MRYYIKYADDGAIIGYQEYPFENQTMTEVTQREYYRVRKENGFNDLAHFQAQYEALTAQYIHEQYPIDKEQAITRKAIAYPADVDIQAKFAEYNGYAENCKNRARIEAFGEEDRKEMQNEVL